MRNKKIVVIGAGNPYRGDDAVGAVFLRRIRDRLPAQAVGVRSGEEPIAMIEAWGRAEAAFVVDAMHSQSCSERVIRFEAHSKAIPAEAWRSSTHAIGVAEAIELSRTLGRLPPRVVVYGIRGDHFDHGQELSPEVDAACDTVVERVLEEIRGLVESG
jgi:hydrogenase maturation protease